jgi:hypothetical protein
MNRMIIWNLFLWLAFASFADETKEAAGEDRITQLLSRGSDPFRMGNSGGLTVNQGDHLLAIDATQAVKDLRVRGILKVQGGESCALIQIGNRPVQLVRAGDLVLIPFSTERTEGATATLNVTPRYLLVVDVKRDSILVAPKHRPQEQITIR